MAGRVLGFLTNLVIFPIMAATVGYVFFDQMSIFVNNIANFPMDGINTLTWLKYIFTAGVFIYVLAICWNHMAQSQNEQDQVT